MKRSANYLDAPSSGSFKMARSGAAASVPHVGSPSFPMHMDTYITGRPPVNGITHVDTPRPKAIPNGGLPTSRSTLASTPVTMNGSAEEFCEESRSPEFFLKLSGLNKAFVRWIDSYMAKGVHYDFTPVCNDYIRFISGLRERYPELETDNIATGSAALKAKVSKPSNVNASLPADSALTSTKSTTSATSASKSSSNSNAPATSSSFSLGSAAFSGGYMSTPFPKPSEQNKTQEEPKKSEDKSNHIVKSLFSFDSKASDSGIKPFTFTPISQSGANAVNSGTGNEFGSTSFFKMDANAATKKPAEETAGNDNDEYEPPKAETVNHEQDALYSVKCKLFYNHEGKFVEKGKGMLYVKKLADDENKHQLLVRADNAIGTIFLNIHLSNSLPVSQSKSGVLLSCIPNPPLDEKEDQMASVTFFIKVRNVDAANELCEKLKSFKA